MTKTLAHTGGFGVDTFEFPGPFHTIEQMERRNQQSGRHYFDRDAKRFFRSRISDTIIGGRIFIDSIQFVDSHGNKAAREYKVMIMSDDGDTHHLVHPPDNWDGQARVNASSERMIDARFSTGAKAVRWAKKLIAEGEASQ